MGQRLGEANCKFDYQIWFRVFLGPQNVPSSKNRVERALVVPNLVQRRAQIRGVDRFLGVGVLGLEKISESRL